MKIPHLIKLFVNMSHQFCLAKEYIKKLVFFCVFFFSCCCLQSLSYVFIQFNIFLQIL